MPDHHCPLSQLQQILRRRTQVRWRCVDLGNASGSLTGKPPRLHPGGVIGECLPQEVPLAHLGAVLSRGQAEQIVPVGPVSGVVVAGQSVLPRSVGQLQPQTSRGTHLPALTPPHPCLRPVRAGQTLLRPQQQQRPLTSRSSMPG